MAAATIEAMFSTAPATRSPWEELEQAYRAVGGDDPAARVPNLLRAARMWIDGAQEVDRAGDVLAEAAALELENPEVQAQLIALAEQHDRFDLLLAATIDGIERAADVATLVRLNFRAADLLAQRARTAEAEHHLASILAVQPGNTTAAEQLREIYRRAERWQDLADLQERQLEALAETLSSDGRRLRLRELADLYQHTLNRPFETVDYLTRLVAEDPADLPTQLRLADLYDELAIWPRLIETLQAVLQRETDSAARVPLLLRIARTYDQELELPDRAIETFQLVLSEQPHNPVVLQALDRLYEAHERPLDLANVLRLRVDLAEDDPPDARRLLQRLGRVLEGLGGEQLEAAAECLGRARTLGPRDPELEEALARVLVQAGRPTAAVELLRAQVDAARGEGRPPEEVAALLVRLARVQLGQLGDAAAARVALEEGLETAPGHGEVLRALSALFRGREEWRDFARVQELLVDAEPELAEAAEVLFGAGLALRDRVGDAEGARRVFLRALDRDQHHAGAIDALLGVVRDDLDQRETLLRLKLELEEEPRTRARTLADLGRVLLRRDAPSAAASALYQQALDLDDECVPALDALSELLVAEGRLEPARALLVDAVERLDRSREGGPLYYRLGQIFERLEQDDDGNRYLVEALRLDPQNLLLRIAIGQNRFRAAQWREALRYLGEVGDDPTAAAHPEEASEALYLAGRCESQLRRADRAATHYEAALRLNPAHLQALTEQAAVALEKRQWTQAAELLERKRPLLGDADELCVLHRTLGDVYLDQLGRSDDAASCYEQLLANLPEDEATRLEVLPHVLPVLRKAGRHAVAAEAAESLAGLLTSMQELREMLLVAATEHAAAGAPVEAERHFRTVLRLDPTCLDAAEGLHRGLVAAERGAEAAELLQGFLDGGETPAEAALRARHGALHAALGQLRREAGDRAGAIAALERAAEIDEDIVVLDALLELYGDDPAYDAAVLQAHRRLVALDGSRVPSLRTLARASVSQGPYRASCFYQALDVLGQLDEADQVFVSGYAPPALDADAPYPGELGEEDRRAFLGVAEVQGLHEVLALLWDAAPALLARDLKAYGVGPADRVSPVADSDLAKVYSACARALGVKQTALYVRPAAGRESVQVVGMAPPALIVSPEVATGRSVPELRFVLGRALELTHPAYILASGLERGDFSRLLASVLRAFHPRHMRGRRDLGAEAAEQANQLRRAIPFKIGRRLGEIFRERSNIAFDSGQWRQAVLRSANRAGLVLCGDLHVALRLVIEEEPALAAEPIEQLVRTTPAIRDLVTFAVSNAYYVCRVKLGMAGSG